jgi:AraC-like DNA-binding protein
VARRCSRVLLVAREANVCTVEIVMRRYGSAHHRRCHTLRDRLSTPIVNFLELFKTHASGQHEPTRFGGNGALTQLLCGGMALENRASNALLAILPSVLPIERDKGGRGWLGSTTRHILSELNSAATWTEEVVTRLAGILLIQAVRAYFEENAATADCGWLAAVRDQRIARALAILHSQPHRSWTVMSLARRLAMSRSTFATRFKQLVGEPPHRYVTRLRIDAAAEQLRTGGEKLSAVATVAGYRSAPRSRNRSSAVLGQHQASTANSALRARQQNYRRKTHTPLAVQSRSPPDESSEVITLGRLATKFGILNNFGQ